MIDLRFPLLPLRIMALLLCLVAVLLTARCCMLSGWPDTHRIWSRLEFGAQIITLDSDFLSDTLLGHSCAVKMF